MRISEQKIRQLIRKRIVESSLAGTAQAAGDFVLLSQKGNVIRAPYENIKGLAKRESKRIFSQNVPKGVKGVYRVIGHEGGKAILAKCNSRTGHITAAALKNAVRVPAEAVSRSSILFMNGKRGTEFKMVTDTGKKVLQQAAGKFSVVPYNQPIPKYNPGMMNKLPGGGLSQSQVSQANKLISQSPMLQNLEKQAIQKFGSEGGKKVAQAIVLQGAGQSKNVANVAFKNAAKDVIIDLVEIRPGVFGVPGTEIAKRTATSTVPQAQKLLTTTLQVGNAAQKGGRLLSLGRFIVGATPVGIAFTIASALYSINDYMKVNTEGLENKVKSIVKNQNDLLSSFGILYQNWDTYSDEEFIEWAKKNNFPGAKPRHIQKDISEAFVAVLFNRRQRKSKGMTAEEQEIFDVMTRLANGYYIDLAAFAAKAKKLEKEMLEKEQAVIDEALECVDVVEGDTDEDLEDLPTSDVDPVPEEEEEGGQAQEEKPKSGWARHPSAMRRLFKQFVKRPDYAIHGPRGGTYREWQRWYMTATRDPQSWELLGKEQRKYLNNAETIKLLRILLDPSLLNESSRLRRRRRRF